MKKYSKPELFIREMNIQTVLNQTSLPLGNTEVNGSEALGKGYLWEDDEE